jgi:hypothetical protein
MSAGATRIDTSPYEDYLLNASLSQQAVDSASSPYVDRIERVDDVTGAREIHLIDRRPVVLMRQLVGDVDALNREVERYRELFLRSEEAAASARRRHEADAQTIAALQHELAALRQGAGARVAAAEAAAGDAINTAAAMAAAASSRAPPPPLQPPQSQFGVNANGGNNDASAYEQHRLRAALSDARDEATALDAQRRRALTELAAMEDASNTALRQRNALISRLRDEVNRLQGCVPQA